MICRTIDIQAADLDELVQIIWLDCWLDGIRPTALRVRSRCWDFLRAKGRHPMESLDLVDSDGQEFARDEAQTDERSKDEAQQTVNQLMEQAPLSSDDKQLIWLVYYQGLTVRRAGEHLGLTYERTELQLAQALLVLQNTEKQL